MKQPSRLSDSQRRTLDEWVRQEPQRSGSEARRRFLEAVPGAAVAMQPGRARWAWAVPAVALVLTTMAVLLGVRDPQDPMAPIPDVGEHPAGVTQFVHVLSSGTVLVYVSPLQPQEVTR